MYTKLGLYTYTLTYCDIKLLSGDPDFIEYQYVAHNCEFAWVCKMPIK